MSRNLPVGVSKDPHQPTRPPETARTEGPWAAPNPLYGRSRIGKKTTRIVRFESGFQNISPGEPKLTELFIIKKKVDLTFQSSRTAHAQQISNASPRLKAHTFPTWILAVHHKLKFKIKGVDESKTEHEMTGYSGTITHFKSTVII